MSLESTGDDALAPPADDPSVSELAGPSDAPTVEQAPDTPEEQDPATTGDAVPTSATDELADTTADSTDAFPSDPTLEGMPTAGNNAAIATDGSPSETPTTSETPTNLEGPLPSSIESSATSAPSATGTMQAAEGPGNSKPTQITAAVAGGVVGGLALISLGLFLVWFLRKRSERRRRSTMLTSMFGNQGLGRGEKGGGAANPVNRTSLGPTPISEKVKDSIINRYQNLRGRLPMIAGSPGSSSPEPTVDLDRGTSQFGPPPAAAASRADSRFSGYDDYKPTTKERLVSWWGRLGRSGPPKSSRADNDPFAISRSGDARTKTAARAVPNAQPDFNTLLRMDEEAAQRSGAAGGTGGRRRSTTAAGHEHFLGGLAFDFEDAAGAGPKASSANPFSDDNAARRDSSDSARHESATIPGLVVGGSGSGAGGSSAARNPFSDANAIGVATGKGSGPATYVQDLRRSRGRSVSADHNNLNNGTGPNYNYPFRSSVSSMGSSRRASSIANGAGGASPPQSRRTSSAVYYSSIFNKRSTKFRSDPFDLDRPELLSNSSRDGSRDLGRDAAGVVTAGVAPPMPAPMTAHLRGESYASWTSRYSGVSEDGGGGGAQFDLWSDPGPDVGPAVAAKGKRTSRTSETSVGKAL